MAVRYDASSRIRALEEIARGEGAHTVTIFPDGIVATIAKEVVLELFSGRLVEAQAGAQRGLDALIVLALSESGRITDERHPASELQAARYPEVIGLVRQAEVIAPDLLSLLSHLGGLAGVPSRTSAAPQDLPPAAVDVLAMVDGRSHTAELLGRSPHPLKLTARILHRLAVEQLVKAPEVVEPEPLPEDVVAPVPGEMEGSEVEDDVASFLSAAQTPATLVSDDAFQEAFTEAAVVEPDTEPPHRTPLPRSPTPHPGTRAPLPDPPSVQSPAAKAVRDTVPITTKRPAKAPARGESAIFEAAGVSGNKTTWGAVITAGVIVGILGALFMRCGADPERAPDAGFVDTGVETSTVSTSTTATTSVELGPDGRPPIAGPDAPEDVKRAESLLNAGAYTKARALLETLRGTRPDDATVFILSGHLEADVGRLSAATGRARRALELDPNSYRGWVLKGSVLQFRGRFNGAKTAYQRALSIGPEHPMTPEIESVLEQMQRMPVQ